MHGSAFVIAVLLVSVATQSQSFPAPDCEADAYCDTELELFSSTWLLQQSHNMSFSNESQGSDQTDHLGGTLNLGAAADIGGGAEPMMTRSSTMDYGPGSPTELKFIHIPKHAGRSITKWGRSRGFAWSRDWINHMNTFLVMTIAFVSFQALLLLGLCASHKPTRLFMASIVSLSWLLPFLYCLSTATLVVQTLSHAQSPMLVHGPAVLFAPWHAPPVYFKDSPYADYPQRFMVVENPYKHMIREFRCEWHGYMAFAFGPILLDFSGAPVVRIVSSHWRMSQRQKANANDLNRWIRGMLQQGPSWWFGHIPFHKYMLGESGRMHVPMKNVLYMETLDEDFADLVLRYGLEPGPLPEDYETTDVPDFEIEDLEESTMRMIEDWFRLDFELFNYPRLLNSSQAAK